MKKCMLLPNDNMLSTLNSRNKEMSFLEQRGFLGRENEGSSEQLEFTNTKKLRLHF